MDKLHVNPSTIVLSTVGNNFRNRAAPREMIVFGLHIILLLLRIWFIQDRYIAHSSAPERVLLRSDCNLTPRIMDSNSTNVSSGEMATRIMRLARFGAHLRFFRALSPFINTLLQRGVTLEPGVCQPF